MKLRRGDMVRFRRGSNEYVGRVYKISPPMHGCIVEVLDGPERDKGAWTVAFKSIVRVEVPVLTEKERAALAALRWHELTYRVDAVTVRDLALARGDGSVTGAALSRLEKRGLVQQVREGVTGMTSAWGLTEEARRVGGS